MPGPRCPVFQVWGQAERGERKGEGPCLHLHLKTGVNSIFMSKKQRKERENEREREREEGRIDSVKD